MGSPIDRMKALPARGDPNLRIIIMKYLNLFKELNEVKFHFSLQAIEIAMQELFLV